MPNCPFPSDSGKFWVSGRQVHALSFETTLLKEATSVSPGGGLAEYLKDVCPARQCLHKQNGIQVNKLHLLSPEQIQLSRLVLIKRIMV